MEARELRIGNKVDLYGSVATITRFDFNDKPPCGLAVDEGKPIPLTEEWLLKFGFEKHYGNNNHLLYSVSGLTLVRYETNKDYNGYWLKYYQSNIFNKVKHVHQLQNLYFALTGKEL